MKASRRSARAACAAIAVLAACAPAASASPEGRIVGGTPATIEQVPFQAAIVDDARFGGDDFDRHYCGGTLITPRIVQTAAHCVVDGDPDGFPDDEDLELNDLDVVVGRATLSGTGGQRLNVVNMVIDPGYDDVTGDLDAAWLALGADAAPPAAPIKIAGPGEAALWAPGAQTRTSGWGLTSDGGDASDDLRIATVPVIPDSTCDGLGGLYEDFNAATMVCAGHMAGGIDACQGDSGGPLAAPGLAAGAPVTRLVGIVSFGDGCALPDAPTVYTRVAGPAYDTEAQAVVDQLEAGPPVLPDAGSIYGSGAVPPPPATGTPPVPQPQPGVKKCKPGQKLKKGKCVKKKRKKRRR